MPNPAYHPWPGLRKFSCETTVFFYLHFSTTFQIVLSEYRPHLAIVIKKKENSFTQPVLYGYSVRVHYGKQLSKGDFKCRNSRKTSFCPAGIYLILNFFCNPWAVLDPDPGN